MSFSILLLIIITQHDFMTASRLQSRKTSPSSHHEDERKVAVRSRKFWPVIPIDNYAPPAYISFPDLAELFA